LFGEKLISRVWTLDCCPPDALEFQESKKFDMSLILVVIQRSDSYLVVFRLSY